MGDSKPRIGLVLGGGGARGAFSVGAINYLVAAQKIRDFPVISGTSTGALLGSLVCTRQFAKLEKIYTTVTTSDIVNPHASLIAEILGIEAALFAAVVFGGKAVFSTAALQGLIDKNVDFDRVIERKNESMLIYNTVDLITGQIRTFNNREHRKTILAKALLASASEPVFMDPVELAIDGEDAVLVDGGIRELIPLAAAFQSGVEVDAFVVITTQVVAPAELPAAPGSLLSILGRTMDLLLVETGVNDVKLAQVTSALLRIVENAKRLGLSEDDLYAGVGDDLRQSLAAKRAVPIYVVSPKEPISNDSLDFDPAHMREMMDMGIERATEVLETVFEEWPPLIDRIA